ncbi:MAG: cytochrome P450 [Actinomycetota bacterium]|nr:cytochrome P450 [Actinomycetota bacterium]
MPALARPLPVRVICDVLGLPDDFAQTKQWADALASIVEPVIRRADRVAADRAATEMVEYLRAHIARHRARGEREDLLGTLVAAHDADDGTLSEDELLGNLILLFVAGHETTTNLLGNGLLTLLRQPRALAQLRADPEAMSGAVDEMLRFESSVNMVPRHVVAPYAIGDVAVPSGDVILFMPAPPTATRPSSPTPTVSTSREARILTSPSARASTTASARRWRGWRRKWPSRSCCATGPTWRWPGQRKRRRGAS